ncbi:transposase [Geobacter sulfurreducens]|uniref:transposase n=1 Tax=Geobacter sulfurreducens TaxID=35554 RepID=UPI001BDBD7A6|nr:transposase [Geobacter sulfurreducens]QVW34159.1 transposase [Geobacter sulfurreducens]
MGESKKLAVSASSRVAVDTFAGRVHVEWDPDAAVTPFGQLPFFIEFLKASGLYDAFVSDCPLRYTSPNAPNVRDILGTLLLSILAGHRRYAHITTIRTDRVNPELLGMEGVASEDSVRRALSQFDEAEAVAWLDRHLASCTHPLLSLGSWVLDTDNTVKPLYGKQEGAVKSYNPKKRGRPSHSYHSYFMGNTRMALGVEVEPGNRHTGSHVAAGLWRLLDSMPKNIWPAFIRGDVSFGSEGIMRQAEERELHYLTKLRLSKNVRKVIDRMIDRGEWEDAGQGFRGAETTLQLTGWTKRRRVIVLKRLIQGDILLTSDQLELAFIETGDGVRKYEYQVLVTSMPDEILTIAQLYRDRGDSENCFDELKNQWGWGGFTTQDIQRCRVISRMIALVYNWWSLYTRLLNPDKRHEAITSRPLMLQSVGRKTTHAGQTVVTITSSHAKSSVIQRAMQELTTFFKELSHTAEQLGIAERVRVIALKAFRKLLAAPPPVPLQKLLPEPG